MPKTSTWAEEADAPGRDAMRPIRIRKEGDADGAATRAAGRRARGARGFGAATASGRAALLSVRLGRSDRVGVTAVKLCGAALPSQRRTAVDTRRLVSVSDWQID
mmetsp:Transcript_7231/g.23568  ORF Transcript_7231/g.23568 Transcript_7231/m.23568 type:complete len:105 (+) Transcript_7231:82-396(+)